MMKKYKNGMYGGKFLPFHKGHMHCVEIAASECETLNLILFCGGAQEREVLKNDHREFLTLDSRIEHIRAATSNMNNIRFFIIDVSGCFDSDGNELWDDETPLVISKTGELDAVYASEPSYAEYFSRAYPNAEYRIIDTARKEVPISATMVREMTEEEASKWIV